MTVRVFLSCALAFVWVAAAAASEQGSPRHRWWQSEPIRQELGLTDRQSAEIGGIFEDTVPRLRAGKRRLDELEASLSALIAAPQSDEEEVSRLIDRVEAARSEINKTRTLMLYRMHRVLSPDQRVRMKALHERWEKERHHGRDSRP